MKKLFKLVKVLSVCLVGVCLFGCEDEKAVIDGEWSITQSTLSASYSSVNEISLSECAVTFKTHDKEEVLVSYAAGNKGYFEFEYKTNKLEIDTIDNISNTVKLSVIVVYLPENVTMNIDADDCAVEFNDVTATSLILDLDEVAITVSDSNITTLNLDASNSAITITDSTLSNLTLSNDNSATRITNSKVSKAKLTLDDCTLNTTNFDCDDFELTGDD